MEATARHVLDQRSVAQELRGSAKRLSGRRCRPWPANSGRTPAVPNFLHCRHWTSAFGRSRLRADVDSVYRAVRTPLASIQAAQRFINFILTVQVIVAA
jgi:hypothetical protein